MAGRDGGGVEEDEGAKAFGQTIGDGAGSSAGSGFLVTRRSTTGRRLLAMAVISLLFLRQRLPTAPRFSPLTDTDDWLWAESTAARTVVDPRGGLGGSLFIGLVRRN